MATIGGFARADRAAFVALAEEFRAVFEAIKSRAVKPGTLNGQPVAIWTPMEFTFRLL